jgi:cytoplasmic iron level regulating protein YaaA (DUF328/UPF0246 family)
MIIAPSKTQELNKKIYDEFTTPELLESAGYLVQNLKKLGKEKIGELLKTKEKLTELNWDRFSRFSVPFDTGNAAQAIMTFKGDVYSGLDTGNYGKSDFNFAQKHLRILSGLYGVLKPLDLIQPYRLEMATKFSTDKGKNLYEFWSKQVTEVFNRELKETGNVLINLASVEYFKVLKVKQLNAEVITPSFKEKKGSEYKVVAIHSKRARGMMANYIIKNRIDSPEEIKKFSSDGYGFNSSLSDEKEWVFTRG